MAHYVFRPKDVCSSKIELDIIDGIVHNLVYTGGCNGNLKAIGALAEGMKANELADRLAGICCGPNYTSCGDQLSKNLKAVLAGK